MSQTVLITGATAGLGLELARQYRARGARLVLVGRRTPAGLDPELFTPASYCRVDLAQPYAASLIAEFLARRAITRLDALIHNAALAWYGPPERQTPAELAALLQVNLGAPLALTHGLLPLLRPAGAVVFVSSVAAGLPVPRYAAYGASKAALEALVRSLRRELRGQARVLLVRPGAIRTGIHARAGVAIEPARWRRFPHPARIAGQIIDIIDGGASGRTLGLANRLVFAAGRWAPALLDWAAGRRL